MWKICNLLKLTSKKRLKRCFNYLINDYYREYDRREGIWRSNDVPQAFKIIPVINLETSAYLILINIKS